MNQITVDAMLGEQFRVQVGTVEVRDDRGHVLGYFTPAADESLYRDAKVPISETEAHRRAAQGGGRPLKDILHDLDSGR